MNTMYSRANLKIFYRHWVIFINFIFIHTMFMLNQSDISYQQHNKHLLYTFDSFIYYVYVCNPLIQLISMLFSIHEHLICSINIMNGLYKSHILADVTLFPFKWVFYAVVCLLCNCSLVDGSRFSSQLSHFS